MHSQTNHFNKRLYLWLILSTLSVLSFALLIFQGLPINTNMLALLPGAKDSNSVEKIADNFANTMGKQVVILVGNPDQDKALKASDMFSHTLQKSGYFSSVSNGVNSDEQQAWATFYFPYRLSLLSDKDQKLITQHQFDVIAQQALFNIYNPIGISNSKLLQNDPFSLFQHFILALPKPSNKLDLYKNHLMTKDNSIWYSMINATLKDDSFSLSNQNNITRLFSDIKQTIKSNYPQSIFLMTGMLFYAKAGTDSARHDVSIIGVGSLIGIILLMLISFRSLSPLLLTLFSSAIGFIFAFIVTYLIFGKVFLFTLVFGASLIGISVDYAFFYYADRLYGGNIWQPRAGLKRIFSGITLGLLNVIIAYLIIAIAPFPGLRQLATFAISGLFMSYLTVVCLFPYLLKPHKRAFNSFICHIATLYLKLWQKLSIKKIMIIYMILAILAATGISKLHSNDDIRILESIPKALKANEQQLKSIIGSDVSTDFVIITGKTPDDVITHEHTLITQIKVQNPNIAQPVIAISQYLPSLNSQQQNYNLVRNNLLQHRLSNFLNQIGVDNKEIQSIEKNLRNIPFKPLTINDWLNSPVSQDLKFLWMGKFDNSRNSHAQFASVILLSQKLNMRDIKILCSDFPYANFINKADEISHVFKTYRQYISYLLIIVFIALFLLLFLRYKSLKKVICYFAPPTMATLLSLAVFGIFNVPITLFSILALILVLGIAVDYVLFFAETKLSLNSTMLAVTLSAITTILSFGLLAFSQTPVIHYFGLAVFIGIASAFLLSPLASKVNKHNLDTQV
ncbi:MMPL family transporter [Cysteiniphilum halobium]|uniref:MMPL family transporter n=1 Tax=Cysteiniphilum halobium TaxID=2219059 RepID=UPI000E64F8A9|nr:MMPL family transporter [Cysteiniphilum halobium]